MKALSVGNLFASCSASWYGIWSGIVPPGGYHSPKLVAGSLFTILGENGLKLRDRDFIAPTAITAQQIAYEITNHNVPTYYVSEALSRAAAATELPSGIEIE